MQNKYFLNDFITPNPDIPIEEYRYYIVGKITHLFGIISHIIWLIVFFILDVYFISIFNLFSIAIFVFNLKLNRNGHYLTAIAIAGAEVIAYQTISVIYIGWGSGFQYYLLCALVLPFLVGKPNIVMKYLLTVICASAYLLLEVYYSTAAPMYTLNETIQSTIKYCNILFSMTLITLWSMYFNRSVNEAEESLNQERKRSEALLYNILPTDIVKQLKSSKEVIADDFNHVSVLFLDIVNFTALSTRIGPKKLVKLLNNLFFMLDQISEKYELEKIKTIGDAYMVASGAPVYRDDTAERVFKFSLEALKQLPEFNHQNHIEIQLRIGISTGPVIAGVIGKNKYTYDLWGNTVNTAARLESTAEPNTIHVGEKTYLALNKKYQFEKRPPLQLKGIGKVQTYQYKNTP